MKKRFSSLIVGLLLLCCILGCTSSASDAKLLAETEFDGLKIRIYYDSSITNNDGLYYQNDSDGFQYPLYQIMYSSDHSKILYLDYADVNRVFEDETEVFPVHTVHVKIGEDNVSLAIYHLDASKECWKIGENQKEYRMLTCSEAPGKTSLHCSGGYEISSDEYRAVVDSWTEISETDETLNFEVFMMIGSNQIFITDHPSVTELYVSKAELENGNWVVCTEADQKRYYQLSNEQVLQLKNLVYNGEN